MESASDDNKPFLVELIHAVASTVKTRHRHPVPVFTVTQSAIYTFQQQQQCSSSYFKTKCTHQPSQAWAVRFPPNPSHVVLEGGVCRRKVEGGREGRINNVIGPVTRNEYKLFTRWHHVSGSWLMSDKLVSLRMTRIRSKEFACRIRSNWTCKFYLNTA